MNPEWIRGLALLSQILSQIIGYTGAGWLIGMAIERWLWKSQLPIYFFSLLGFVLAMVQIVRMAEREQKK